MNEKTILGTHTAKIGFIEFTSAMLLAKMKKMIYTHAKRKPRAI
jgi:hypothetical protein